MEEDGKKPHKCKHLGCDKTYVSLRYLRAHETKEHTGCPPECKLCEEFRNRRKTRKKHEDDDIPILMELPQKLCERLMDGNDKMLNNSYLVPLPRTPSVRAILQDFIKTLQDKEIADFAISFYTLFCEMVGPFLLYEIEKKQYQQILTLVKSNDEIGDYYGGEHLLRLVAKLPQIAYEIRFDKMDELKEFLEHLAHFMEENSETIFLEKFFRINPDQKTLF
ncbi:hypothetical protein EIN_223750 [Entamoeba invadens IP1]|uniref:C2H2-type domain-containing protein n=1 Tax=Entamoeba invadens IP1 TaxID=370355 RepID=A0A0A1U278_ENTIV|nr:hypothetical protein EIN_223750 [Entamoeba invadens IP1]ELP88162.1 hypothetical protein EIN_223750 [Entamoeba invadens IP1]|eukprot:XP_004254933.1 hypothetical protein EIN_223750 [Entamoeba invadens IP1]